MTTKKYAMTLADIHSYETFSSLKSALSYARRAKDEHGGACVFSYGPDGLGACHARWTRGQNGKVFKAKVGA